MINQYLLIVGEASECHHFLHLVHDTEVEDQLQTARRFVSTASTVRHSCDMGLPAMARWAWWRQSRVKLIRIWASSSRVGDRVRATIGAACNQTVLIAVVKSRGWKEDGRWLSPSSMHSFVHGSSKKPPGTDASDVSDFRINMLREKSTTVAAS